MAVTALLALALTGCVCDSTSHSEVVIAPEEPVCHPWPLCTSWTSDSAIVLTPAPAKATEKVKTGPTVLADFEFSAAGESVRVRLKSVGLYRLEYDGPEGSILIRAPGDRETGIPALAVGYRPGASGFRVLEFKAGSIGNYELIAGPIQDQPVRGRLFRM